jgi:hypothetical protein
MKTRTYLRAGADPLQTCKREKEYWKAQAERMESIANCSNPYVPPQPLPTPVPPYAGGGYVGGVWYPDRSGTCG